MVQCQHYQVGIQSIDYRGRVLVVPGVLPYVIIYLVFAFANLARCRYYQFLQSKLRGARESSRHGFAQFAHKLGSWGNRGGVPCFARWRDADLGKNARLITRLVSPVSLLVEFGNRRHPIERDVYAMLGFEQADVFDDLRTHRPYESRFK